VNDFNGDGLADILWEGRDGSAMLWEMNGPQVITSTSVGVAGSGVPGSAWDVITG
jgi:hypothetical protein